MAMWYGHDGPDGWGWFWMIIMMGLFWIPLLIAIAWFARGFGSREPAGRPGAGSGRPERDEPDAREVARRAYAKGDLERERYLQIIDDLDRTDAGG